ncbi:hypothetical protein [Streptomyces sp. NPDC085932]|uniref:hypothetical protein n=1 Tax=Streptomyces sp. NPDC085932 TaxID=3365741 RepID=UPI0037CCCA13
MPAPDRRPPRSPAVIVPPLMDSGLLAGHDCSALARARAVTLLAGAAGIGARDARVMFDALGFTETDLLLARDLLRDRRAQRQVGAG